MIDVEAEIKLIRKELTDHYAIQIISDLVRRVAAERDRVVELCIRLETEWRNHDDWVGEKRPKEIKDWVLRQIDKGETKP